MNFKIEPFYALLIDYEPSFLTTVYACLMLARSPYVFSTLIFYPSLKWLSGIWHSGKLVWKNGRNIQKYVRALRYYIGRYSSGCESEEWRGRFLEYFGFCFIHESFVSCMCGQIIYDLTDIADAPRRRVQKQKQRASGTRSQIYRSHSLVFQQQTFAMLAAQRNLRFTQAANRTS